MRDEEWYVREKPWSAGAESHAFPGSCRQQKPQGIVTEGESTTRDAMSLDRCLQACDLPAGAHSREVPKKFLARTFVR
jgi:hypothetical protein